MGYPFPPDIERLVQSQMASGQYASEDELLLDALRALADRHADLSAVEQAISDLEAGDTGRPLTDVANEIRNKHGWSSN